MATCIEKSGFLTTAPRIGRGDESTDDQPALLLHQCHPRIGPMPGTPSPQPNTEPHSQKTGSSSTCFGRPPMIRPWLWPHCLFGSPGSSAPAPQMVFAMHPDRQSAFVTQGSSICYRHKLRPVPIDRRCTSSPVLGKPAGSMCPAVRSADTNGQNGPSDRHTRRYRYRAGSQTDHSECAKPAVCAECWRPDHSCPHA